MRTSQDLLQTTFKPESGDSLICGDAEVTVVIKLSVAHNGLEVRDPVSRLKTALPIYE